MEPTSPSTSSLMPALNSSVPVPPVAAVPNLSAHRRSPPNGTDGVAGRFGSQASDADDLGRRRGRA
jgi:hypothetical protein